MAERAAQSDRSCRRPSSLLSHLYSGSDTIGTYASTRQVQLVQPAERELTGSATADDRVKASDSVIKKQDQGFDHHHEVRSPQASEASAGPSTREFTSVDAHSEVSLASSRPSAITSRSSSLETLSNCYGAMRTEQPVPTPRKAQRTAIARIKAVKNIESQSDDAYKVRETLRLPDNSKYIGETLDGQPHGYGKVWSASGYCFGTAHYKHGQLIEF
eukprot:18685-Heterococcus_DN1.PRE.4